jgi:peptidoglycan hydrolase FlgJ
MPLAMPDMVLSDASRMPRRLMEASAVPAASQESKISKDFEAMFIRQALESILPSGESSAFGTGTAGGIWRSMFADRVSAVLADRTDLNLIGASLELSRDGLKGGAA